MLTVLEEVARNQPVSLSELVRVMGTEKSALQRSLMTLSDAGWITVAAGTTARWQLTGHIQLVARYARENDDLRLRIRPALERLRDASGETVLLNVPDAGRFVIVDVAESRQLLRTAPSIGHPVPGRATATARAVLPYLSPDKQIEFLGQLPQEDELPFFAITREVGYAISDGDVASFSSNIGAPVFDADGQPVAAIVVSGPRDRLTHDRHAEIGLLVRDAANSVSQARAAIQH